MLHLFTAMFMSTVLVLVCVIIHYEVLRVASHLLPRLSIAPRPRILVAIGATFFAHTVEVWMYAVAYWLLSDHLGIGSFGGDFHGGFEDCLYFSTVTYTSLGLGDLYPLGGLRLVAGVETLTGLMMITWSASFTYLAMEKFWGLHGPRSGQ